MPPKYRDIRKRLRRDGWIKVRQRGSHEWWKHPSQARYTVVAGPDGRDVPIGTLKSILRKIGIKRL